MYYRFTSLILAAGLANAQEQVLGVYILHRHGDRTAKSTPPANLTDLGYQQVFSSGSYYRSRYVSTDATNRVRGLNSDLVLQSQITAAAPVDTVLQNSAQGFLQGLYPPVGEQLGSNELRNGTVVQSPLNGYQLIPVQAVTHGTNSENSAWLQGTTNCANAQVSSNDYFTSSEYLHNLNASQSLYDSIYPDVERTFTQQQNSFKNAYAIWDLLNVASIHNKSAQVPRMEEMFQLKILADRHEFGLAYNASEPIRAVTGSIIAGEVLAGLNSTITSQGKSKLNIQFGAYAGMLSFFGLSSLTTANPDFYGVPEYASSMVWELVTNSSASEWPSVNDIYVRFLFANGTASDSSGPVEYPLFGTKQSPLPWNDFVEGMNKFSISGQDAWCKACGNSTGVCSASYLNPQDSSSGSAPNATDSGSGISKAVCGVIGAMVTLAVLLTTALLVMFVGGFRFVKMKNVSGSSPTGSVTEIGNKA